MDQEPDAVETLTLASAVETLTLDDDNSADVSDPLSPSTRFTSPSDLCFELDSLHDLALRGQWRSVLDKVSRARSLSLLPNPHDHLVYLAFNALALFKLRRFADSAAELDTLDNQFNDDDPFSSPRYRYESHPHSYPTRSGSMIPFSIRYIHAELPQRLGDRPQTLDRLYSLLDLVRRRIADNPQSSQWPRRELFLMSAICSNHFSHREFDVALSLARDLLDRSPSDPVLLSRLGYIQMQIGDLEGSKATFARVEKLGEGRAGAGAATELESLAARNRAMVLMVEKDYVSAVREYEECIERDPADVVAVNNKALCLMYSRDLSDSIKVLEGALERVPTSAVNETLIVNLCSMYELAYVNHGEVKKSLNNWIAKVAPDDFDPSCTRI